MSETKPLAEDDDASATKQVSSVNLDVPAGITPLFVTESPNAPLELYSGPITIASADRTTTREACVSLEWVPSASIIARYEPDEMDITMSLQQRESDQADLRVQIPKPPVESRALLRSLSVGNTSSISLYVDRFQEKTEGVCASLTFQVVNFTNFHGCPISFSEGGFQSGRIQFVSDKWGITLDEAPNNSDITKQLNNDGGYGITHTGQIERADSSEFSIKEGLDIINSFRVFLSFCRGRFVGIPIIRSVDLTARHVYEEWLAPIVSPWKSSHNWFPTHETTGLSQAFAQFLDLWGNQDWRDTLVQTVHWYVNANMGTASLEGSIVLAQIALERLAWTLLVIDKKALSANGFDRLHAPDKFNLLFNQLGIPPHLPTHLSNLAKYCKDQKNNNALGNLSDTIAHFRNAVVHPPKTTKASPSHQVLYEACESELWSLELSLLAILGYTGSYHNRIDSQGRWIGNTELVPWTSGKDGQVA